MRKTSAFHLLAIFALAACGTKPTAAPSTTDGGATAVVPATQSSQSSSGQGPSPTVDIATISDSPNTPAPPSSNCSDGAAFVADVTVEDNSLFDPGQSFEKIWRIKNIGTCVWTDGYKLVFSKGDKLDAPDSSALQETQPGNTLDVKVELTAPSDETVTRARADFEIRNPANASIPIDDGSTLWVVIRVDNGEAPKTDLAGSAGGSSGPGFATVSCAYTTDPTRVAAVFAALNGYRATQGLPPYVLNGQLNTAAQAHAADMACNNLFYHTGSNNSTAKSRVAASGYIATAVTENVYGSYPPLSATEAINWWANDLADPRHNENLLSTKYIEVGIGYAFFNNFGYYVIDFAAP